MPIVIENSDSSVKWPDSSQMKKQRMDFNASASLPSKITPLSSSPVSFQHPPKNFSLMSVETLQGGIEELEQTIENDLNLLQEQATPVETWADFITSFNETATTTSEHLDDGFAFLEQVIPYQIVAQLKFLSDSAELIGHVTTISFSFLQALETGSQGLALISKENILKESRKILQTLKDSSAKTSLSSPQDWEEKLEIAEQALEEEKKSFRITASYTFLSCLNTFLTYFSFKFPLHILSSLSSPISCILGGFDLKNLQIESKEASEDKKIFHQQRHSLSSKEPLSLEPLLKKRQLRQKELLATLEPQFESLEPKIKAMKKRTFICFFDKLHTALECESNEREMKIKQILDSWGDPFFTNSLKDKLHSIGNKWQDLSLKIEEIEETFFECWYAEHPKETLLKSYIDHQETIQITTKNILRQLIDKKYQKEGQFIDLKVTESQFLFGNSILTTIFNLFTGLVGLLTFPFFGLGLISAIFSLAPTLARLSFLGVNSYYAFKINPQQSRALLSGHHFQELWAKLKLAIHSYEHETKKKQLLEKVSDTTFSSTDQKSNQTDSTEKAKLQVDAWRHRLNKLEESFLQDSWEDFAKSTGLSKNSEDFLSPLEEALLEYDPTLPNSELEELLVEHLGIIRKQLSQTAIKDDENIKADLKKFFMLNSTDLMEFIKQKNKK